MTAPTAISDAAPTTAPAVKPGDEPTTVVPVGPVAYRRWLQVWADLRDATDTVDLADIAKRHEFSVRQVQWVRRARQAGLLNSPTPPAIRIAELGTVGNHHQPVNGLVGATTR